MGTGERRTVCAERNAIAWVQTDAGPRPTALRLTVGRRGGAPQLRPHGPYFSTVILTDLRQDCVCSRQT